MASTSSNLEERTEDEDFKSQNQALIDKKYEMCVPLLRFPLVLRKFPKISTYIPISINYFEVIHFMDTLMADSTHFHRLGLPWHPLLSRLYFAEVFFIQTLRAMRHAKIGSSATKRFTEILLKCYPPETIPIPGPLVPILQGIASCNSENNMYGSICPLIRSDIGPETASLLSEGGTQDFILPNIPLIAGFLNALMEGTHPPDYSNTTSFDDSENHTINGHVFEAENWQLFERLALLSPGLNCPIESTPETDENMNFYGPSLDIPVVKGEDSLKGIARYMLMEKDSAWFHNVVDVMKIYCTFFKESTTLEACPPHGATCGLVRSELNEPNITQNIANELTHAFPGKYPYKLSYTHTSYETEIPQKYQAMAQLGAINTYTTTENIMWDNFNHKGTGLDGPYWNQYPPNLSGGVEQHLQEVRSITAKEFFIEDPLK